MKIVINAGRWQGYVELKDPLPMSALALFEDAATEAFEIDKNLGRAKAHAKLIPALLECITEWKVDGFPENLTPETFPGAGSMYSKVDIAVLINFLVGKILKLIEGKDPNG